MKIRKDKMKEIKYQQTGLKKKTEINKHVQ